MNLSKFYFFHNPSSRSLDVILHGASAGIDSPFIQKIFKSLVEKNHSVVAFNFPYIDEGKERASDSGKEEVKALKRILNLCKAKSYQNVNLIGKSIGAVVASYFLRELPAKEHSKYSIVVLGYIKEYIDLQNFRGPIVIIQGAKDRFGDIEVVKKHLKDSRSGEISFYEIPKADHSYRDPETREPVYEDGVIELLRSKL